MEDIIYDLRMKYIEDLEDILQCPVCWEIPTGRLIYTCTKGHHICEQCKRNYPLFTCPSCESNFDGSRNYIAEEISTKFEDMKSSLLEPNHYTNRRIEKRSIATQTDEAIMISNDTQTVSAVANQNSRETQYDPDMSNESFETTEDKSIVFISSDEHSYLEPKDSEEMSVDVKSACIVKTCQHSCIKSNMIDHINKEHSNIIENSTLENDLFHKSWDLSLGDKLLDFVVNIADVGILHLNISIDDDDCVHGKVQVVECYDAEVQLRYVLSFNNSENFSVYEPFKGTVNLFENEELETEKIFLTSQFIKKFLIGENSCFECHLTLFRTTD